MRSISARILAMFAAIIPVSAEVAYISHTLIQTKPFKVMADPPAQLFMKIAVIGAICSVLAVIAAVRSSWKHLVAAPLIAVSMATLLYLATYFTLITLAYPPDATKRSHVSAAAGEIAGVTPSRHIRIAEAKDEYIQQLGIASAVSLLLACIAGGGLHLILRRKPEQATYIEAH